MRTGVRKPAVWTAAMLAASLTTAGLITAPSPAEALGFPCDGPTIVGGTWANFAAFDASCTDITVDLHGYDSTFDATGIGEAAMLMVNPDATLHIVDTVGGGSLTLLGSAGQPGLLLTAQQHLIVDLPAGDEFTATGGAVSGTTPGAPGIGAASSPGTVQVIGTSLPGNATAGGPAGVGAPASVSFQPESGRWVTATTSTVGGSGSFHLESTGNQWADLAAQAAACTGSLSVSLVADAVAPAGQGLDVAAGCDFTLDLNGHTATISSAADENPGILVPSDASLTVTDSSAGGVLETHGGNFGAGIGGGVRDTPGAVTIAGGTVKTYGGQYGAGIGAAQYGSGAAVTVSGGTVLAYGGERAAGIGTGYYGTGGSLTINGGTVTANGGGYAPGIGAGGNGSAGPVIITGGTVTANGGGYGPGIGGGTSASVPDVTISGGTVTATGGYMWASGWGNIGGAGIGGAPGRGGGTVTITGGTVVATGAPHAAGIGGGHTGNGGTVTISGGHVIATGGSSGAGIGGGYQASGGSLTVVGRQAPGSGTTGGSGTSAPAATIAFDSSAAQAAFATTTDGDAGAVSIEFGWLVTYDPAGGAFDDPASSTAFVADGHAISDSAPDGPGGFPAISRVEYGFAGWVDMGGTPWDASSPITSDLTLTAKWLPYTYGVSFAPDAHATFQAVPSGAAAGDPVTISADVDPGYHFGGWSSPDPDIVFADPSASTTTFTMPALGGPDGATVDVTGSILANNYTVFFAGNGGVGGMPGQGMSVGSPQALIANAYTRSGYAFAGWATSPDGPVEYADGATVSDLTLTDGGSVTLYAQWTPIDYTVTTTQPAHGTISVSAATAHVGDTVTLHLDRIDDGYHFVAWHVTPDLPVTGDSFAMPAGDVSVTAKLAPNSYTVVFDANGGAGSMASQVLTVGEPTALTPVSFTKDGSVFAGWATRPDGPVVFADQATVQDLSVTDGATVTLYAIWRTPVLTLSADQVRAGGSLTASGSGFAPGGEIVFVLHSTPVHLATVTADASGGFNARVTIPADTPAGSHTLQAADASGAVLASVPLTVTAAAVPPTPPTPGATPTPSPALPATLPQTGSDVLLPALLALLLIVLGAAALLIRRRRTE